MTVETNESALNINSPGQNELVADPVGRLMTIKDVMEEVRLSRAMVYRCMQDRDNPFPKPIKIGNASRWAFVEIVSWKQRALAMRDEAA